MGIPSIEVEVKVEVGIEAESASAALRCGVGLKSLRGCEQLGGGDGKDAAQGRNPTASNTPQNR